MKRSSMKYLCECGKENRVKPILMGFATHCKKCGKEYERDEVLQEVARQKEQRKNEITS